jgi:hypothetical protein
MIWMEDLREEVRRRQAPPATAGEGARQAHAPDVADDAVTRADALVRTLLDQMNQIVLGGRGSVWAAPATWGVYLWELWWEPTRERGPYLLVTLLRDSRGTPYLRVQNRRLALEDARIERRLQRALRAALLQPRVYTPRAQGQAEGTDLVRAASMGSEGAGNRYGASQPAISEGPGGIQSGGSTRSPKRTRRGRNNGRDDA